MANWIKKNLVIVYNHRINDGDDYIMIEAKAFGSQIGENKDLKQVFNIGILEK